jgi:hypothetical protein
VERTAACGLRAARTRIIVEQSTVYPE